MRSYPSKAPVRVALGRFDRGSASVTFVESTSVAGRSFEIVPAAGRYSIPASEIDRFVEDLATAIAVFQMRTPTSPQPTAPVVGADTETP